MTRTSLCATLLSCAIFAAAAPYPPAPEDSRQSPSVARLLVASSVNDAPATLGSKEITSGARLSLYVVVEVNCAGGGRAERIHFSDAPRLMLGGQNDGPFEPWRWDHARDGRIGITWYEVKAEKQQYNNTSKDGARIRYVEKLVGHGWSFSPPSGPGTRRYRAEVRHGGRTVSSAPAGWRDGRGLSALHRISVREGDDLPGWMTAWANLPYIHGSSERQVEQYVGGDCADVITGALRRMGRADVPYTYSQGFGPHGRRIFRGHITTRGRFVPLDGDRGRVVRFERGDLLVFRKPSRHIAVFTAGVTSGSNDAIRVVHTYGEPGVVAEQIYAVAQGPLSSVWGGLRGLMDRLLGRGPYRTGVSNVEATVDEVEVIRLK